MFRSLLTQLVRSARQLLRAPCCVCGCKASPEPICGVCSQSLRQTQWGVAGFHFEDYRIPVLWRETYGGPLTASVYRSKYAGDWGAAHVLGRVLGQLPRPWMGAKPLVIPIPLADQRLGVRGYNQAHWIARSAAKGWQLRLASRALRKTVQTRRQAESDHASRQHNLVGLFRAAEQLRGQRVLLVDDIMTTGATLREATRAIHAVGGQVIAAAVIARVEKHQRTRQRRHVSRRPRPA